MDQILHKLEEKDTKTYRDDQAALHIQRAWRKKKSTFMNADVRWEDATKHAQLKVGRTAADSAKNTPRQRWKRSVFFATQLRDDNKILQDSGLHDDSAALKILETQHWLELVDAKHRYGSNLKWYHRRWQEDDTTENFFKWLDQGAGKDLSLNNCPREQLEKERITYLSAEQRLNYLVNIDSDGKLRWARSNELVDTTAGHWKDAGQGRGIVPLDTPENNPIARRGSFEPVSSASVSASSLLSEGAAAHYVGTVQGKNRWIRAIKTHFTLRGMMEKLLRKTVQRNTWIYAADKNFNIFIGIKDTGTFQHSSFLSGGLVTSAGLISVKQGLIHTLSPLSGHYRTSIDHFRKFISVLEERGVDIRSVKISKAEVALWGIEHIAKWKKAQGEIIKTAKEEVTSAAHKVVQDIKVEDDNDNHTSWKRDILEGRGRAQDKRKEESTNQNTIYP